MSLLKFLALQQVFDSSTEIEANSVYKSLLQFVKQCLIVRQNKIIVCTIYTRHGYWFIIFTMCLSLLLTLIDVTTKYR